MLPTALPTVMGVNTVGAPETGGPGGAVFTRTFTASMTPTGTLQVRNRGRISGRPGVVAMSIELPGTIAIRIRRN